MPFSKRRMRVALGFALVGLWNGLVAPAATRAECVEYDPWPSFLAAVSTASWIAIGDVVTETNAGAVFQVRLTHSLRGEGVRGEILDFSYLTSGIPPKLCDEGPFARVAVGDVVAIATGASLENTRGVNAIAFLDGVPNPMHMRGVEELTISDVLAAMPSEPVGRESETNLLGTVLLITGAIVLLGSLALLLVLLKQRRITARM
jgi:hypothetical protein